MTVEFIPKSEDCFAFAAPDGHWFELLRKPGVRAILGGLLIMTNDPADIDRETAVKLGDYIQENKDGELSEWSEKVDWGMYREFFEDCDGFTTF